MSDYLKTAGVWPVLDLIVAEFRSDPTSVACFDARIVTRAGELVDAWKATRDGQATSIEVGTILSRRTKEGIVEFVLNGVTTQMDLDKAREVRDMLSGAIEAAVSDGLIFTFLTTKVGLAEAHAAQALLDFRELRQGSRATVFPQ